VFVTIIGFVTRVFQGNVSAAVSKDALAMLLAIMRRSKVFNVATSAALRELVFDGLNRLTVWPAEVRREITPSSGYGPAPLEKTPTAPPSLSLLPLPIGS